MSRVLGCLCQRSDSPQAFGGTIYQDAVQLTRYGIATVSIDLPHHGNGPTDPKFDDIETFMGWIDKIIDKYRRGYPRKKIILSGHSFGPNVAMEYAARHPDKIDAMVLFSPVPQSDPSFARNYRTNATGFLAERRAVDEVTGVRVNEAGDTWGDRIELLMTFLKRVWRKGPFIKFVRGENDAWFPEDGAQILQDHYPDAEVATVPEIGHNVFIDLSELNGGQLAAAFESLPEEKRRPRFVPWTIVEFLRRKKVIEGRQREQADNLSDEQRVAILQEINPLFRTFAEHLDRELRARQKLELWNIALQELYDKLLIAIPEKYPDFYSGTDRKGEPFKPKVDELIVALGSKKKLDARTKQLRDNLLTALSGHLSQNREAATATRPPLGKNYITLRIHEALKTAHVRRKAGLTTIPPGLEEGHPLPSRVVSRVKVAADDALSRGMVLMGKLVAHPLADPAPYRRLLAASNEHADDLAKLGSEIDIPAKSVLALASTRDIREPFILFQNTERVVLLSGERFGTPAEVEQDINLREEFLVRSNGIGGNIFIQIFGNLRPKKILSLYYFEIDSDGNRVPCNPESPNGNAEINFEGSDGKIRTLEVLRAEYTDPPETVSRYLRKSVVQAVYSSMDAISLEGSPMAAKTYRDLNVPWVVTETPPTYMGHHSMEPRRLPVFVDAAKVRRVGGDGSGIFVAVPDAFRDSWSQEDTWTAKQDELDRMLELSGDGRQQPVHDPFVLHRAARRLSKPSSQPPEARGFIRLYPNAAARAMYAQGARSVAKIGVAVGSNVLYGGATFGAADVASNWILGRENLPLDEFLKNYAALSVGGGLARMVVRPMTSNRFAGRFIPLFAAFAFADFVRTGKIDLDALANGMASSIIASGITSGLGYVITKSALAKKILVLLNLAKISSVAAAPETLGATLLGALVAETFEFVIFKLIGEFMAKYDLKQFSEKLRLSYAIAIDQNNRLREMRKRGEDVSTTAIIEAQKALMIAALSYETFLKSQIEAIEKEGEERLARLRRKTEEDIKRASARNCHLSNNYAERLKERGKIEEETIKREMDKKIIALKGTGLPSRSIPLDKFEDFGAAEKNQKDTFVGPILDIKGVPYDITETLDPTLTGFGIQHEAYIKNLNQFWKDQIEGISQ